MSETPKGGLPTVGGGRALSTGGNKPGGLPSLAAGVVKTNTGTNPLAALKAGAVGNVVNTFVMSIAAVLDYTASTSALVSGFVSKVSAIVGQDRKGIELKFFPVVFGGDGNVKVGTEGQVGFYKEQRNIQGSTYVFRGIQAALNTLPKTQPGIITVITDDPPTYDPDIQSGTYDNHVIDKIKVGGHTLLVIVDTSENKASFEAIAAEYRVVYGRLGDDLIVIGGAQDPKPIVDAVIEAKAQKVKTGAPGSIGGQLPALLKGKGTGNLQIATGSSSQILGISDQSK